MKLIIGSRESRLAVIQAELVMDAIARAHPEIELQLLTMKTIGDRILDRPLDKIGGKGLFVRELDAALREGRADLSVHSCKDLPMDLPPDLPLAAFTRREDPRDALVLPLGTAELRGPIGCSSLRRRLQLKELFPDIETAPIRGNVLTRLRKLDSGEYGALVLAAAGLKRLGLEGRISRYFSVEEILPAAGQGILAVQRRAGLDSSVLECLRERNAEDCALAERAFVRALDGGCSSPVAAHAVTEDGVITITGLYVDGAERMSRDHVSGPRSQGEKLAWELARRMKEAAVCREK